MSAARPRKRSEAERSVSGVQRSGARPSEAVGRMRRLFGLGCGVLIGALLFGCDGGGDDDDEDAPPAKVTRLLFDMTDLCAAKVSSPIELFRDAEGKSELGSCLGPADAIERELFLAQLDEGAPLNAEI